MNTFSMYFFMAAVLSPLACPSRSPRPPSRSARPGGEGDPLGKPLGVGEPRNIPVGFKVLRGFILSLILVLHRDKLRQAEALNQADQLNQSRSI